MTCGSLTDRLVTGDEIRRMPEEDLIRQLLQEMLISGRHLEEVCRDHPELAEELRKQWKRVRVVEKQIDALFPSSDATRTDARPSISDRELPQISGYNVQGILGRGGMGVVYKAQHLALNRPVALKMVLAGAFASSSERERLLREAQAVAALRHPNIVTVYDVGECDGKPFFTMELVEGVNLAQLLAGMPQQARDAAALVATLADAAHSAHQAEIVHRDLKPANVLVTMDGTPKITDFGLARHFEGDAPLTFSGALVGTPSYMAPEQASGRADALGPNVDIYSLGALLYEMLTGRPPFRAATALETQRQVIEDEPAAPSRLNSKIPRDLETICLKCLQKVASHRFKTARDLADDLRRFLHHEPILARRIGPTERVLRWVRRKPTAAALAATGLALIALAVGGGMWLVQQQAKQQAESRIAVGTDVTQAVRLRKGFHFQEARAFLEQARHRLEPAGPDDLRKQVEQAAADLGLVENLDRARQRAAILVGGRIDLSAAEPQYIDALVEAGLGGPGDDSVAVAERVRGSPVRAEIIAALDDWASITEDGTRRAWLLAIARGADPDPSNDQLRRPELWDDAPELARLALERVKELSPQLLTAFGRILNTVGGADPIPVLTAAQARFPDDYWINFELGLAWNARGRNDEATGFYRAAIALRPEASSAHQALGMTFFAMRRLDEAIDHFEKALEIDPTFALAHNNIAAALKDRGRFNEAIAHLEEAIRLNPDESAGAHANLGTLLRGRGRLDDAIRHFEESIRLYPDGPLAHFFLGDALREKGRFVDAITHLQRALQLDVPRSVIRECWFDAACSAVLVSADQELREAGIHQWEPSDLRRRALDWLRASLELRATSLDAGTVANWDESLSAWQTEPALASVRDRAALAKFDDAERQQWERLWADVSAVLAAEPAEDGLTNAAGRRWDKAAGAYARALERSPTESGHTWFEYAALLLLAGDRPGYARACARMVELRAEGSSMRAYHVARACTLTPDAGVEASLPGRIAEAELTHQSGTFWSMTQRGALHYRAGRFPEAVALFEQSLRTDAKPGRAVLNWLWLALANERLGKSEEARRWLNTATGWLDQFTNGMPPRAEEEFGLHLHNWLEAHILRREAEAAIMQN